MKKRYLVNYRKQSPCSGVVFELGTSIILKGARCNFSRVFRTLFVIYINTIVSEIPKRIYLKLSEPDVSYKTLRFEGQTYVKLNYIRSHGRSLRFQVTDFCNYEQTSFLFSSPRLKLFPFLPSPFHYVYSSFFLSFSLIYRHVYEQTHT